MNDNLEIYSTKMVVNKCVGAHVWFLTDLFHTLHKNGCGYVCFPCCGKFDFPWLNCFKFCLTVVANNYL